MDRLELRELCARQFPLGRVGADRRHPVRRHRWRGQRLQQRPVRQLPVLRGPAQVLSVGPPVGVGHAPVRVLQRRRPAAAGERGRDGRAPRVPEFREHRRLQGLDDQQRAALSTAQPPDLRHPVR